MNLSLVLNAQDATFTSTLRRGLQQVQRFVSVVTKPITVPLRIATAGVAGLRDLGLARFGLQGLVSSLDNVIERGARLEVVRKSFAELTGSGDRASFLAAKLRDASQGMLKISEAMQIANRGLAGGLTLDQLGTAIEFIAKKAVTTGKDARSALDTVITGLSRGSTLFLDDFGILVDGIDGVRSAFDAIKGAGAFDALGPAAQKAEVVRAAVAEMQVQMGRLGVTGRELAFTWGTIKSEIGGSVEGIVEAIAKSEILRSALEGARDALVGIREHFAQGGSIRELVFGKGEGGVGLFQVGKAALLDAARNLGISITAAIIDGGAWLLDALPTAFTEGAETLGKFLDPILGPLASIPERFGIAVGPMLTDLVSAIRDLSARVAEFIASLPDWFRDPQKRAAAGVAADFAFAGGQGGGPLGLLLRRVAPWMAAAGPMGPARLTNVGNPVVDFIRGGGVLGKLSSHWSGFSRFVFGGGVPGALIRGAGGPVVMPGLPIPNIQRRGPSAGDRARAFAARLRRGAGWGDTSRIWDEFTGGLPGAPPAPLPPEPAAPPSEVEQLLGVELGLQRNTRRLRRDQLRAERGVRYHEKRLQQIEFGRLGVSREARELAEHDARELRERGFIVRTEDRKELFRRRFAEVQARRSAEEEAAATAARERASGFDRKIREPDTNRDARRNERREQKADQLMDEIRRLGSIVGALVAAIGGDAQKLARIN